MVDTTIVVAVFFIRHRGGGIVGKGRRVCITISSSSTAAATAASAVSQLSSRRRVVAVAKLGERFGVVRVLYVFGQNNSTESSMANQYWQGFLKFDCVAFQYFIVYS